MQRPKVGIAVVVRRFDEVLIGLRKSIHASGMYGLPGGHLEGGESFEACAIREIFEETGIVIKSAEYWTTENVLFPTEDTHYVTIFMITDMPEDQEAKNMEPEKCVKWEWLPWDKLPTNLMPGITQLLARGMCPIE